MTELNAIVFIFIWYSQAARMLITFPRNSRIKTWPSGPHGRSLQAWYIEDGLLSFIASIHRATVTWPAPSQQMLRDN